MLMLQCVCWEKTLTESQTHVGPPAYNLCSSLHLSSIAVCFVEMIYQLSDDSRHSLSSWHVSEVLM